MNQAVFFTNAPHSPSINFQEVIDASLEFMFETPVKIVAIAVAGVAIHNLFPPIAHCLYGAAGASVLTRLVVKAIHKYNDEISFKIKWEAVRFDMKYPKAQTIALLFAVAISCLSPLIGLIIGVAYGIFNGILIDPRYKVFQQDANQWWEDIDDSGLELIKH